MNEAFQKLKVQEDEEEEVVLSKTVSDHELPTKVSLVLSSKPPVMG